MFNSLFSHGVIDDARVLDLFAGSGALGIEALSRGARHVTFVEQSRAARAVLEANLSTLRLEERSTVLSRDGAAFVREGAQVFDLALLDPPYEFDGWPDLLTHLQAEVAVIESDREIEPPRGWTGLRSRRYGGTLVSIIRRSDATEPADAGSGIETRSTK